MSEASDWILCRLVDRGSFIFPRLPFWLGQVEFSEKGQDRDLCVQALLDSMQAFAVSESGEGWERLVRARILMPGMPAADARRFGAFHLTETLQAFNSYLSFGMSELRATDAGYLYDVRHRAVLPLKPPWKGRDLKGISAMIDDTAHHPLHILNTLFVAPAAYGELGSAFRRSSHWRELAKQAQDEGEALLLYWMAAECLCKQMHKDEIGAKLLAACGFPTGKIAKAVDPVRARQLSSIAGYQLWKKRLASLFDALRTARNQIVHAGYRHVDLPKLLRDDQQGWAKVVLPVVTRILAEMALQALNLQQRTLAAMWEQYECVLEPRSIVSHAEWIIGKLENSTAEPSSLHWQ